MVDRHPLVRQLRFTRSEFLRGVRGVSEEDATKRLGPMNCLSWNVGHLAWQEQNWFLRLGCGEVPFPELRTQFAYGAPACTPPLRETLEVWKAVTAAADPWLDTLTVEKMLSHPDGRMDLIVGNMLQRTIYHYWYHCGENLAIRQQLGHKDLPEFVGDLEATASYRPDAGE